MNQETVNKALTHLWNGVNENSSNRAWEALHDQLVGLSIAVIYLDHETYKEMRKSFFTQMKCASDQILYTPPTENPKERQIETGNTFNNWTDCDCSGSGQTPKPGLFSGDDSLHKSGNTEPKKTIFGTLPTLDIEGKNTPITCKGGD